MTKYECACCFYRYEGETNCPKCGCDVATSVLPGAASPRGPHIKMQELKAPDAFHIKMEELKAPDAFHVKMVRPGVGYQYQQGLRELLLSTRHAHRVMLDELLLQALGMTAEEAMDSNHRTSLRCSPDKDLLLLDGEPVVEIHKPVLRGDELVTSYKILRTLP